jgi:hypothetical protein
MNDELEKDTKEIFKVMVLWRVVSELENRKGIKNMNYKE